MSEKTERSLQEQIHKKLVVDEPDEEKLVGAIEGAVEIVKGTWSLRVKDKMEKRDTQEQIFTYLLTQYAAARVSDGKVGMSVSRSELYEHFDRQAVKEVCEHGWIRHWDGQVQIRPRHYKHTADELAMRFADADTTHGDTDE